MHYVTMFSGCVIFQQLGNQHTFSQLLVNLFSCISWSNLSLFLSLFFLFFSLSFPPLFLSFLLSLFLSLFSSVLLRTLQKESARLQQLTPQLIRKAKESAYHAHPDHGDKAKELEVLSHQWVGHVRALIDASQQANLPWTRTSRRLVHSARSRKGLEKQVSLGILAAQWMCMI